MWLHGMVRPQLAYRGMASNMEGSCEYIEYAVADNRKGVVLQLGGWVRCNNFSLQEVSCYESIKQKASDLY